MSLCIRLDLCTVGCLLALASKDGCYYIFVNEINITHSTEQNREERDDYIDVLYPNIKSGYESNFEKAKKGTTSGYGVGYDYGSVIFRYF